MKYFVFVYTFLILLVPSGKAQTDTLSATKNTMGGSLFLGLAGVGGATAVDTKQGFSQGISARLNYRFHTFDLYLSHIKENEANYTNNGGRDLTETFNSSNFGLTYGVGTYRKHLSAACTAGINYSSTLMMFKNNDTYYSLTHPTGNDTRNYHKINACFGLQASVHGKILGFGMKAYYNISNNFSVYSILAGLEINI